VTDPFSRVFISYRRSKVQDVDLLSDALVERGVPIWQDTKNLGIEHTDSEIRKLLESNEISGGCLWISNDYHESSIIQNLEVPKLFLRVRKQDGFFLAGVAADGQSYANASAKVGPNTQSEEISERNMIQVNSPFSKDEATVVANRILAQRVKAIHKNLPDGAPFKIDVTTKVPQSNGIGPALKIDWHKVFNISQSTNKWESHFLPAIRDIAGHVEKYAPSRIYEFSGFLSIGASVALGATFMATRKLKMVWKQQLPNQSGEQLWSIGTTPEESGYQAHTNSKDRGKTDLAVLVSVASDVMPAFQNFSQNFKSLKAVCEIKHTSGKCQPLQNVAQANDVATKIRTAILEARTEFNSFEKIHLFMSVPSGLAAMVGQLSNTFGYVQTYEYVHSMPGGGGYVPSILFDTSSMK